MKKFKVFTLEQQMYDIIVFSETYDTPFAYLEEICEEFRKRQIMNVKVVFDSLLSIGNTSERYAEACFDGEKFISNSFRFIEIKKNDMIRRYSTEYFVKNSQLLEFSILTQTQKEMLRKGIAI